MARVFVHPKNSVRLRLLAMDTIATDDRLTAPQKAALTAILRRMNPWGESWAGANLLGKDTGFGEKTIRRALATIPKDLPIHIEVRPGTSNKCFLTPAKESGVTKAPARESGHPGQRVRRTGTRTETKNRASGQSSRRRSKRQHEPSNWK